MKALMFIEYNRHRWFTVEEILQHEIADSAYVLVDKGDHLRQCQIANRNLAAEVKPANR